MKPTDIYNQVTQSIINLLEDHQENWRRPWITLGNDGGFAYNPATKRHYRGINQFLLSAQFEKKRYLKHTWMTFNQISKLGGKIIKGEKSTPVIFFQTNYIDQDKRFYTPAQVKKFTFSQSRNIDLQPVPLVKLYRVFNVMAQSTGLDETYYDMSPQEPLSAWEKIDRMENAITFTGAHIEHSPSNQAYYHVACDVIYMPEKGQFREPIGYYSTCLHELGHWTGHASRLIRTFGKFGDETYSREELIAELTSAFTCASLGIEKNISSNASYIKSWLGILKEDSKAIVNASSEAQKASDYILGGQEYASSLNPEAA